MRRRARQIIGLLACAVAGALVFGLTRTDVPAVSELPLAPGLRVLAAVEAGNQVDSSLPGHWRFIALGGPASSTGSAAIVREAHALMGDGWSGAETYVVPDDSDVVTRRRVPLGTPDATTELEDPTRHINVVLSTVPGGRRPSLYFPQPLWQDRMINAAASDHEPVIEAQLGRGPDG